MASFLSRYQQGEREHVWTTLRNFEETVREERHFDDALAVAVETMQRVRRNVEILIDRLTESGYQFDDRIKFPLSPPEKHPGLLSFLKHDIWTLGLSARAWIEEVGEVNLSGTHPKWKGVNDRSWNTLEVQFEQRDEFVDHELYEKVECELIVVKEESVEIDSLDDHLPQHIHRICVGFDGWYESRCGNGAGWTVHRHEILVPDRSADATIDLEVKQMFFVDYLRHIFKWGGFPNFERFGYQPHDEPVRTLARDLLPI